MNGYKIRVNVPIILLFLFLGVTIYCRYTIESKIGFVLLPIEVLIILILLIRSRKLHVDLKTYKYQIFFVNISFMIYRIMASYFTTGDLTYGAKKILYYEIGTFILLFYALLCISEESAMHAFAMAGTINGVIGVYETAIRSSIFMRYIEVNSRRLIIQDIGSSSFRARTIFMHPTICGIFCVCAICVSFYYPFRNKWFDLFSKVIMLICLLGTKTRGSWIACLAILAIFFLQKMYDNKRNISINSILYMLIVLAMGVFVVLLFYEQFVSFGENLFKRWMSGLDGSNAANYNRMKIISMGLKDYSGWGIKNKLIGKGKGYALSLLAKHAVRGWKTAVDNTYLTILLDYGLIGFGFMAYFLCLAITNVFKEKVVCRMSGAALLGIFIAGFFYDMYWWFTSNFLISFFLCSLILYEVDDCSCKKDLRKA